SWVRSRGGPTLQRRNFPGRARRTGFVLHSAGSALEARRVRASEAGRGGSTRAAAQKKGRGGAAPPWQPAPPQDKLTLSTLSLIALFVPACAAETGPEAPAQDQADRGEEDAAHVGKSESAMFTCWSNGQYICHPDLYVEYATSQVYSPGNPGNLYPGTYITYVIGNKGTAAAGPFTSVVTDYYGTVLKSQTYSGLPVGQTTSIFV